MYQLCKYLQGVIALKGQGKSLSLTHVPTQLHLSSGDMFRYDDYCCILQQIVPLTVTESRINRNYHNTFSLHSTNGLLDTYWQSLYASDIGFVYNFRLKHKRIAYFASDAIFLYEKPISSSIGLFSKKIEVITQYTLDMYEKALENAYRATHTSLQFLSDCLT